MGGLTVRELKSRQDDDARFVSGFVENKQGCGLGGLSVEGVQDQHPETNGTLAFQIKATARRGH